MAFWDSGGAWEQTSCGDRLLTGGSLSVARGCFPAADSQFTIGQAKSKNAYTHEGMDRWNGERWLSSQEMLDEDE